MHHVEHLVREKTVPFKRNSSPKNEQVGIICSQPCHVDCSFKQSIPFQIYMTIQSKNPLIQTKDIPDTDCLYCF